jgi:hypothetical protein
MSKPSKKEKPTYEKNKPIGSLEEFIREEEFQHLRGGQG